MSVHVDDDQFWDWTVPPGEDPHEFDCRITDDSDDVVIPSNN